jgi:hypothetical protein
MDRYYYARITEKPFEHGINHTVHLQIWSEDGRDTWATLSDIYDPSVAAKLAALWTTGGHEMVISLLNAKATIGEVR